jgi:TonB family protein
MTELHAAPPAEGIADRLEGLFFRRSRQRPAAIVLVAAVHLIAVWAIFATLQPHRVIVPVSEFQLTILKPAVTSTSLPPPEWKFVQPRDAFVPAPDIQMEPDSEAPSITTSLMSQILPPRPDPYYLNRTPDVPDNLRLDALKAAVTLRILVLPDGSVDQAMLVKGSSNTALDKVAIAFVEANWRFLPATAGGKPIQEWTTVRVRFAS